MRTLITTSLTAAVLATMLPTTASADTSVADAAGARGLAGGGNHLVWAAPTADGAFALTARDPQGAVTRPDVRAFDAAPQPAVGSTTRAAGAKRLVAVYTRDGDAFELDLASGDERRLALSSPAAETLVAVSQGRYVVVRASGARKGLWVVTPSGSARRLTRTVPTRIAMSSSRVASLERGKVVIRRLSGRGPVMVAGRGLRGVSSLWLTRYRVGWATFTTEDGTRLFASRRFAGSGGPYELTVIRDPWTSPSRLHGIVTDGSAPTTYLDDTGVKRFDPVPFHGR